MSLRGSEGQILQAIADIPKDPNGYVSDSEIASFTGFRIEDLKDSLYSLSELGLISLVRVESGLKVTLEAHGTLELRAYLANRQQKEVRSGISSSKVVPKGMRQFDEYDADFFLDLLPGPRRSDGLPESIHFWKVRIEETDPGKTFRVGVLFGPSGCGKSSLVKAGLIPRLSHHIIPVYVEATGHETETEVLMWLRKRVPLVSAHLGLADTLNALQVGTGRLTQKVIIILDEFEQWLYVNRANYETELSKALRQCDGVRIQCILVVRDDFWMALTRFMGEVGIELRQWVNFAAVDLFDLRHARRVLTAFGQALGCLPADHEQLTEDQETFLTHAVEQLAEDGRVVAIRLTLFAEILKGRPWTSATLWFLGGIEGVGVTFLEETFASPQANPRHRLHQKAAQAVLTALLPEMGTTIKGQMRSELVLRDISGYADRPGEFAELIYVLQNELRLITPTDPEELTAGDGHWHDIGESCYQLTHDYLVPSIRMWLARQQRETWRGRAELTLAERSSLWKHKPVNRNLPSVWEWANIRLLTRRWDWTDRQRKMMKRAGRVYGVRSVLTFALLSAGVLAGIGFRRQFIESQQATHAEGLVQRLLDADTLQVPDIVGAMRDYRRWIDPTLRSELEKRSDDSRQKLHASLALLPVDASQIDYLFKRLLSATPSELPVLRDGLKTHQAALVPKLWSVLESAKPGDISLLPAASALASYDPDDARWEAVGGKVAQALVSVNTVFLGSWLDALRPVRSKLTSPLAATFRDKSRPETEHTLATNILADYACDDPNLIANLLMDADPKAYAAFFPIAHWQEAKTLPLFREEITKRTTIPDSDKESEKVKDQLAERQARAAVALLRMGKAGEIMLLLRQSADPRLRSFIVNWLCPLEADPKIVAAQLDHLSAIAKPTPAQGQQLMDAILYHPETSMRRALILAMGTYGTEGLSPGEREPLTGKLLDLYRNDPDAGIHGAAEWTLRQWKQQEKLKQLDAQLMKVKDWGDRRWFVNSQGQTFAVIEGPVEFRMGSPPTETGRLTSDGTPRRILIPRRYAIAATEVSVRQFRRSRPDYDHSLRYGPEEEGPVNGISWYLGAQYCDWLSRQEGLAECYEPNERGEYATGMKIKHDALRLGGYRLPTEAEWEYACRAGAGTSRSYGVSLDLLGRYAWYNATSKDRAWPCGSLQPNELGLFDMLGNVYEWCQDQAGLYTPDNDQDGKSGKSKAKVIVDETLRIVRGGAFPFPSSFVRSASRGRGLPWDRNTYDGFRIARTYP